MSERVWGPSNKEMCSIVSFRSTSPFPPIVASSLSLSLTLRGSVALSLCRRHGSYLNCGIGSWLLFCYWTKIYFWGWIFATASPFVCGSCAELIALAVALHLLLNFDFEQIAKNDGRPKRVAQSRAARKVNEEKGGGGGGWMVGGSIG